MLVFFPSYAALKGAHARWERKAADGSPSVLERLTKHKHVAAHAQKERPKPTDVPLEVHTWPPKRRRRGGPKAKTK